jgi:hypothetical protein
MRTDRGEDRCAAAIRHLYPQVIAGFVAGRGEVTEQDARAGRPNRETGSRTESFFARPSLASQQRDPYAARPSLVDSGPREG